MSSSVQILATVVLLASTLCPGLAPVGHIAPSTTCRAQEPPEVSQTDLVDNGYAGSLPWEHDPAFREFLTKHKTPLRMAAYYTSTTEPQPAEAVNVSLAADALTGMVLNPGEAFSFNQRVGPYTAEYGFREGRSYAGNRVVTSYGGGVCQVSSILYSAAVLADLQIIERHPHSMTVPYVPPGQDAAVCYGVRDFRFRNNSTGPLVLWADTAGRDTYLAIYGQVTPAAVTWHHRVLKTIPPGTISYHSGLAPGAERLIAPGQDGVVVENWITKRTAGGSVCRQMGIDYYRPSPRIIERGPRPSH